jgi:hypothetical protein
MTSPSRSSSSLVMLLVATAAAALAVACGSNNTGSGFAGLDGGDDSGTVTGGGADSSVGGGGGDSGTGLVGDGGVSMPESSAPAPVPVIYLHSSDTLYRLDPTNNQIALVGPFSGCTNVIDLAIDSSSNVYVTTYTGLYKLDVTSAACTLISAGTSYPNSLSFVPKGTVDPNAEALVGYVGATYVHINTTTGAMQNIGSLSSNYTSSGDIVSVINGGTFLTVKGGPNDCGDCLLQVNPTTGDLIQDYGSVNHADVFGLAFWAGTAYGFDNGGDVFSISWNNGALVTTAITVPNPPPNLSFWGAGSTTAAPPMSADGGGLPIQ